MWRSAGGSVDRAGRVGTPALAMLPPLAETVADSVMLTASLSVGAVFVVQGK